MYTTNETRLLRVVKQLNKGTVNPCLSYGNYFVMLLCIYSAIVIQKFSAISFHWSRTKLKLRGAAMQLSFHAWCS